MRKVMTQESHPDRGYVLVTALILIGALSVLGAVGAYKSIVESKVSKFAGDASRAEQVAAAGLQQLFWYWTQSGIPGNNGNCNDATGTPEPGCVERVAIMDYILQNTSSLPADAPFILDLYADSIEELESKTGGIDAYIRGGSQSGHVRVYQYQRNAAGIVTGLVQVPNTDWGVGTEPQVAVWSTSYARGQSASDYPYDPAGAQCRGNNCRLVVYALGRHGQTKRLIREVQGVVSNLLEGVSAMTNAPSYGSFSEMCAEANPKSTTADNGGTAFSSTLDNTVIEVTQAPYLRDLNNPASNPSGTAILSNTRIGQGGKGFRKGSNTKMGLTFSQDPRILYTGHGPTAADNKARGDLAGQTPKDNAAPYDNLPAGELPHNLVKAPVLNTSDELTYFPNGNSQLFELDAYRWAAEQFTCQIPSNPSDAKNGRFCDNAERLRQAVDAIWTANYGVRAWAPVTGRMTLGEFEYNVNYGIPMFGIIRVMLPTAPKGSSFSCTVNGAPVSGNFYNFTNATLTTNASGGPGPYDGYSAAGGFQPDSDGTLDGTARLVVYGSLMFDFFDDANGNNVFDPASGERLLTPLESTDAYMKFEMPILINPVLPRDAAGGSGGLIQFPSAHSGGVIQWGSNGNPVNLAAADGSGWYPGQEGLIPMTDSTSRQLGLTGTMRLMTNAAGDGLVDLANNANAGFPPGNAGAMFTAELSALQYYYNVYVAVADHGDAFSWPVAPFPASINDAFCIGQEDCATGDNHGDRLHLLFPSGYMHGWKVALAALDLTAQDWNTLLGNGAATSGVDVYSGALSLWNQHSTAKDYGDANYPKGSPFNPAIDPGYNKAGELEQRQGDYFRVLQDAPGWQPNHQYRKGDIVKGLVGTPPNVTIKFFMATTDPYGQSGMAEPDWNQAVPISDGTVTWTDASGAYPLLTSDWRDIPAEMYVGGLLDMHAHSNINGIVYTPGPLEWEPGNSSYGGDSNHYSYINGSIITGGGGYLKNKSSLRRYVLVYAIEAVDNINTRNVEVLMRRYARQILR